MPQIILASEKRKRSVVTIAVTTVAVVVVGGGLLAYLLYSGAQQRQAAQLSALVSQGDAAIKQQNYRVAFQAYVKADNLTSGADPHIKAGAAQAAAGIGDKKTAIGYYRQAVAAVPAKPQGTHDVEVGQYQDQITYLGGTP